MKAADEVLPFRVDHVVDKVLVARNHARVRTDAAQRVGQRPSDTALGASIELMVHKRWIEILLQQHGWVALDELDDVDITQERGLSRLHVRGGGQACQRLEVEEPDGRVWRRLRGAAGSSRR